MATSRQQKEEILKRITDSMRDAKSVVFADLHGMSVEDSQALRNVLREHGVRTQVAKKTLIVLAGKENGYEIDKAMLDGQIAIAFSMDDEVAAAQQLYKLGKKNEKIKLVGGIFEGKVASKSLIMEVAQMPSKEELLAKLVGSMRAPLAGFQGVLHGTLRGFVQVCKQISEKSG
ncbi:MAG: 50S ribosomal protein L10 [bacterium]|nr:50S ribosomal protein L10 [bacterium]